MIIQNNIAGINASRNKGITEGKMRKNLEKLSSGYRINRAGDDAAGLTISEAMRGQIRGLDQAMRNCSDGISMTQTGEGALTEVHSILQRMKTLAVQSANCTYTTVARLNLDAERIELLNEIDRIGQTSDFADIPLFEYASEPPAGMVFNPPDQKDDITLQVGHSAGETQDVPRYYLSKEALLLDNTNFTSLQAANGSIKYIDDAIEAIADIRAEFGAAQNHLEHTYANLSVTTENITAAESQIRDTDMADLFTDYTKDNIMYQAGNSMCAQANSIPELVLSLIQ